jgi:hypothetical protein
MKARDARGRFRKTNEDLSRFGWLVGAWTIFEVVVLVWIWGIHPL